MAPVPPFSVGMPAPTSHLLLSQTGLGSARKVSGGQRALRWGATGGSGYWSPTPRLTGQVSRWRAFDSAVAGMSSYRSRAERAMVGREWPHGVPDSP